MATNVLIRDVGKAKGGGKDYRGLTEGLSLRTVESALTPTE